MITKTRLVLIHTGTKRLKVYEGRRVLQEYQVDDLAKLATYPEDLEAIRTEKEESTRA